MRQDVELEGTVIVGIGDDFENKKASRFYRFVDKGGKSFDLKFKDSSVHFQTGKKIKIRGKKNKHNIEEVEVLGILADSESSSSTSNMDVSQSITAQKRTVAVLLVNLQDATSAFSVSSVNSMLYGTEDSANTRYLRSTFGQVSLNGDLGGDGVNDVFGPFTIPYTRDTCPYTSWSSSADQMAAQAGIDLSKYQHVVYALPSYKQLACGNVAGRGSLNCSSNCKVWMFHPHRSVFVHEIGHNIGLHHASTDTDNNGSIDSE